MNINPVPHYQRQTPSHSDCPADNPRVHVMRNLYGLGVFLMAALSLLFAAGIVAGEATDRWFFGGALVGALLIAYSVIVLLMRKMGMIGPRKAER